MENPPLNLEKIDIMTEGDAEFKTELIMALYNSLNELKERYLQGAREQNITAIQEIRHKVKPSLSLFEMHDLTRIVYEGKDILEEHGFSSLFRDHLILFKQHVELAISYIQPLVEA
ncbi:hypothetical protein [Mongoliitalea daihaiensis]|uniref:hypothetical protein n=1 Tax=Mongoliitalea daihaiensis TaxID=2782006 RepID=UPI001F1B5224|nr:hypothetical protein [Mongoliitalea daihaiensis]UJP63902.1 hypothetical protein IPZ59_13835 [Mongoliitalea daihaiensis]